MDDRPTKEIKTSGGHKVAVKEWITGREKRQIDNILLRQVEMRQKGTEQEISGFSPKLLEEAEDEAIKLIVVSVDGKTDEAVDAFLELPARDYEEVMREIRLIKDGKDEDTKKK